MARISRRTFLAGLAAGTVAAGWAWHDVHQLEVTRRSVPLDRLPRSFHGFTICHLTDLHMAEYGENQRELAAAVKAAGPDIIVMTGDMVNGWDADERPFLALCDRLPEIAPTYFVTGNHDVSDFHLGIGERAAARGVSFMDNRHSVIERHGDRLYLAGAGEWSVYGRKGVLRALKGIPERACTVLMAHHPAFAARYAETGVDLVLAGHAHGGLVRVPFVGALMTPEQGLFPKYTDGLYRIGATTMSVSRGMGESKIPIRLNCPREIAYLTLEFPG